MKRSEPRLKGTGFLPVIKSLNLNPAWRDAVPADLKYYLEDHVVTSAWYPEADYHVLLHLLAELVAQEGRVKDVWEYFGIVAAQRDLVGLQNLVPPSRRMEVAGIYRNFVGHEPTSIYSLFVRYGKLWSLYHDTGVASVSRSPSNPVCVHVRIRDFRFPSRGVVQMQMAYLCEFARLSGNELQGRIVCTTAEGAPYTEWQYTCQASQQVMESVSQLPLLE